MTLRVKVLSVAKRKKKNSRSSWERAPFDRFPKLKIKSELVARKKRMNKYLKASASFILIPPFISSSFFSSNNENKRQEKTSNDTRTAQENGTK
jgi:hypothetical protein